MPKPFLCDCGSGEYSHWLNDGHGIPLCRVCDKCKGKKLKKYRPDILKRYRPDEPIDPE